LKESLTSNQIVKVDVDPDLQKNIEDIINSSFRFPNSQPKYDFTFSNHFPSLSNKSSTTDKLQLYFPRMQSHNLINLFLYNPNGTPYCFEPTSGSFWVKVPKKSIWITGGRGQAVRDQATDETFEIDMSQINLQNGVKLIERPRCYETADHTACYVATTDGKQYIYVSGGVLISNGTSYTCLDTVKRINVDNPTKWEDVPRMPDARACHTMFSYNGSYIYVIGGYTFQDVNTPDKKPLDHNKTIYRLDIMRNKWEMVEYTKLPDCKARFPINKMLACQIMNRDEILIGNGLEKIDDVSNKPYTFIFDVAKREVRMLKAELPKDELFKYRSEVVEDDRIVFLSFRESNTKVIYNVKTQSWSYQKI